MRYELRYSSGQLEDLTLAEQECNEQATDTTVAIDERVDRFKLGVGKCAVDQHWERIAVVEESFQVVQGGGHCMDRGWNERRRMKVASRWPNPVLCSAKVTRSTIASPHALEQPPVDFSDQPQTER